MTRKIGLAFVLSITSSFAMAESSLNCSEVVKAEAFKVFAAQYGLTNAFKIQLMSPIHRISDDFELRDSNMSLYSVAMKGTEAETEPKYGEVYVARSQMLVRVDQSCKINKIVGISSEFSRK